jgi:hypothetical protein
MAKTIKYSDGTFGMGTEWLHDFLFDRFRLLNANPLTTALFRDKPGSARNGVVLTIIDTNNKGDRVPTKQKWYLWDLSITYQAAAARTDAQIQLIYDFFRLTLLSFKIEGLDTMFSAPLSFFRPALQLISAPAVTVNSRFQQEDNMSGKALKVPEVLEENAVWHLDIDQTVATNAGLDNDFLLFGWDREMYRQGG